MLGSEGGLTPRTCANACSRRRMRACAWGRSLRRCLSAYPMFPKSSVAAAARARRRPSRSGVTYPQTDRPVHGNPRVRAGSPGRDNRGNQSLVAADAQGVSQQDPGMGNPGSSEPDAKKKTLHAAEQNRPDVARARAEWRDNQPSLNRESWSSSTKPGPRPTWSACMVGRRAARG